MKDAQNRIARQDSPPAVTRVIRIRSVGAHDVFSGTIVSESLFGFWTHWDGRRTIPCWKGQAHCPGCDTEQPTRWKGLIELFDAAQRSTYFVELTPLAAKEFLARLGEESMRGLRISIQRERKHSRAPLNLVMLDRHHGQIPKAHDPWPTLKVVWGIRG